MPNRVHEKPTLVFSKKEKKRKEKPTLVPTGSNQKKKRKANLSIIYKKWHLARV